MGKRWFRVYSWMVLLFNLAVILWGACVRATGSGAGCGSHWPLCNGEVVPRATNVETLIEYIHRLSSALALVLVFGLFIGALRLYPKDHIIRVTSSSSIVFMITEALIGAGLVIMGWVAQNDSMARAIAVSIHLVNTFLLLASISLTAWFSSVEKPMKFTRFSGLSLVLGLGLVGIVLLGVSGAITALGDTLFPSNTLIEGIQQDFNSEAHFLIQLRIWHPLIAILLGLYLLIVSGGIGYSHSNLTVRRISKVVFALFLAQLGIGFVNFLLMAPTFLQLIHLFVADLIWITMIIWVTTILMKELPDSN